jgi:hypothetical protein
MKICTDKECHAEAIMAIRNTLPRKADGLVTTIWQFVEDAPKTALPYCGPHGVHLAAHLAALSDSNLHPVVTT